MGKFDQSYNFTQGNVWGYMRCLVGKKRKILIFSGIILIVLSPIWLLILLFWWPDFSFRLSLPIYSGAQQVNRAYHYYGANSGLEVLYFWTSEPVETVQAYYQAFAVPFRPDPFYGGVVTAFGIRGSDLMYRDFDGVERNIDGKTEISCYYTQRYSCVNVRLVSIPKEGTMSSVPDVISGLASSADNATPSPLFSPLKQGTLIIYSYYIDDF